MNNADANKVKQQIVEKIKTSTNILVTVSRDPSVDDLSAAIGLSTILNKVGKHSTAIFSGVIPPAINFLEPDKIFENSADSLRDFIIALDKEKADHLRYKVEGDVVKIFITPYHTPITSEDLDFSQGDFNVELVLALGVDNKKHLDNALASHGQILDDVTIATFTAGEQVSDLGSMDWHDDNASSLSEMVTSISEALKTDKPLLDKQVSTALLTGIVASTDRFSNLRTTSKVMTMAAQLMAAGADQQLIAARLNESHAITTMPPIVETDQPVEIPMIPVSESTLPPEADAIPGNLVVNHDEPVEEVVEPVAPAPVEEPVAAPVEPENNDPEITPIEKNLFPEPLVPTADVEVSPQIHPAYEDTAVPAEMVVQPSPDFEAELQEELSKMPNSMPTPNIMSEIPTSTLPSEPEEDAHEYLGEPSTESATASMNSALEKEDDTAVDIFAEAPNQSTVPAEGIDLPLPPPLPDFSTLPQPLPQMNVTPEPTFDNSASTLPPQSVNPAPAADPSQFQIPGQS